MKTHSLTKPKQDTALAETIRIPLVRAEIVAKHFNVHKRTVSLWAERGDIPCVRVGGVLRFDMQALFAAVEAKSGRASA